MIYSNKTWKVGPHFSRGSSCGCGNWRASAAGCEASAARERSVLWAEPAKYCSRSLSAFVWFDHICQRHVPNGKVVIIPAAKLRYPSGGACWRGCTNAVEPINEAHFRHAWNEAWFSAVVVSKMAALGGHCKLNHTCRWVTQYRSHRKVG